MHGCNRILLFFTTTELLITLLSHAHICRSAASDAYDFKRAHICPELSCTAKCQNSTSAELTVFSKCTLEYRECLEENDIVHAVLHYLLTWVTFPTHRRSSVCAARMRCWSTPYSSHREILWYWCQFTHCYRWSLFEARLKICSVERHARDKNKIKFRTSRKRISFVCYTLIHCEGVDFKVTGMKFMTVFTMWRDAACF